MSADEQLLQSIRLDGSHVIPPNYAADFMRAEKAFLYQRVFDLDERKLVMLGEPENDLSEEDQKWIGLDVDVEIARGMALGELHPETRIPIEDLWPNYHPSPRKCGAGSGGRGKLDSFITITRIPRTKSTPAIAPSHPRIGSLANGPTSLSNLPSATPLPKHHTEPSPISPPRAVGKTSKFFGTKKPPAVTAEAEEDMILKWETSTHVASQSLGRRSASPENIRSPSPESAGSLSPVSSAHPTPLKRHAIHDDDDDDYDHATHFTSPMSERSDFSSIPGSSARKVFVDETQGRPEPSSPTPTQRVRSSQAYTAAATIASSQRSDATEIYEEEDYAPCVPRFQPATSVLVPPSSPALRLHSSDSALDDNIVTPSPVAGMKRRMRPTKSEEEVDEAEHARAERAKVVAKGWSEKYALKSTTSFITPARSLGKRESTSSIPVTSVSKVLTSRPVNVPREREQLAAPCEQSPFEFNSRPRHAFKAAPSPAGRRRDTAASVPKPNPSAQPHGMTLSALERFRFSR